MSLVEKWAVAGAYVWQGGCEAQARRRSGGCAESSRRRGAEGGIEGNGGDRATERCAFSPVGDPDIASAACQESGGGDTKRELAACLRLAMAIAGRPKRASWAHLQGCLPGEEE